MEEVEVEVEVEVEEGTGEGEGAGEGQGQGPGQRDEQLEAFRVVRRPVRRARPPLPATSVRLLICLNSAR